MLFGGELSRTGARGQRRNRRRNQIGLNQEGKPQLVFVPNTGPCGCLKDAWGEDDSFIRRLFIAFILIIYAFAGAGVFYGIEIAGNPGFGNPNTTAVFCAKDYWSCLFFANTLYTTIGFGTVSPCTTGGKCFTMLYTICGIPIMVMTVANLGFLMAYWTGTGYRRLKSAYKNSKKVVKNTYETTKQNLKSEPPKSIADTNHVLTISKITQDALDQKKHDQRSLLPFPIAIFMCLAWILLSGLYFYLCEQNSNQKWSYFDSIYFFVVSISTLGLGDLDASSGEPTRVRTIADFFFIIIGVSLFSMCINIIQYDMEHLSESVGESILQEYAGALNDGHAMGVMEAAAVSNDKNLSEFERKAAEHQAKTAIRKMIRKKGGWQSYLVSSTFEHRLLQEYQKRSHMRLAATQTELELKDEETNTEFAHDMLDKSTSTKDWQRETTKLQEFPDLWTRERMAVTKHVKRIFTASSRRKQVIMSKLYRSTSVPEFIDENDEKKRN